MASNYSHMKPFLPEDDATSMLRIAESFESFGTYADEGTSDGLGEDLPQRFDAAFNYIARGIDGTGNPDDFATAAQRTNYFRETYAYGDEINAPGIEAFLDNPSLREAAHAVTGRSRIVPAIVYANLLVPGQELAVHTDVPEFRGANRKLLPQWLLVTMLHSGLFDQWRIPIATCVSWFGAAKGGAFTFYPDGPKQRRQSIPAAHNSAILLDTDAVFHGVERVTPVRPEMPGIERHTRLHHLGGGRWQLRNGEQVIARYDWSDLRYSISWKAYCFDDRGDEARWREGSDDLTPAVILETLEDDLLRKGVLEGARPDPTTFATMLVQTYVHFP